ncbi:NAD-dependent epimerase/dehydratase family protein [uncultured Sphingomonas sp.]|jgi:nucleoside-diphosphate-sugar epimerase|uniref:NAD-dependent epimerase/dehydratase family protein n=1 Tax=uncultured Sphingomonas sp. TaxID=158754 RepID=UPI0030DC0D90
MDKAQIPSLVVVGARSRAGRAILSAWPGPTVAIHRGDRNASGVAVSDYTIALPDAIPRGSVVVNCVGSPRGDAATLAHVNHEVPIAWAHAARTAGAKHFIQLSSFAVYGRVDTIDCTTSERPDTHYGRSKLAADQELLELCGHAMLGLTIARIPMLFGGGSDKLSQIASLVRRTRTVPQVRPPISRAMLGYDALAAAIVTLAHTPVEGIVLLCDPTPFSYELMATRFEHAVGKPLHRLAIPRPATSLIRTLAPQLHARLLASSHVSHSARYVFPMPPGASLTEALDRLAKPAP